MWQHIQDAICEENAVDFQIEERLELHGGDISRAYKISDQHARQEYFVKINEKAQLDNFVSEAFSLRHIAASNTVAVPKVICLGTTLEFSYLVLSFHHFDAGTPQKWYEFGEQLAMMHQQTTQGQFGWQEDNFIGKTPQPNSWHSNWRTFFTEQRIAWQLQLLQEKSISFGNIDYILDACHQLLQHHKVVPSLVHGDLWQGNIGFYRKGVMVFDPACYYGDREVDIAMTELFGQFPQEFYLGYQNKLPLPDSYQQRKLLYNFYHILNHANLFGGIYISQAQAMLARILAQAEQPE